VGIVSQDREIVAIVFVQAVFGAKPQESLLILQNRVDNALRQALLDGNLLEGEAAGLGVKLREQKDSAEDQPDEKSPPSMEAVLRFSPKSNF
jgi:hypothetical protein